MIQNKGCEEIKKSPYEGRKHHEGKMFGYWKAISYYGMVNDKKSAYICECTLCGSTKIIRTDKLLAGRTTKCADCRKNNRK